MEPGLEAMDRQNRFVSEHLRRIFVQIYRIVDNVADAQDLTQETFIKALQHQEQLKDEQKAAHWLSRIATNTAIDFLRRNSRATFCEIDEAPESHTRKSGAGTAARRASGIPGRRVAPVESAGAAGINVARRGGLAGGGSGEHTGLLEGDGAVAYRECAHETAPVHGKKEAVGQ